LHLVKPTKPLGEWIHHLANHLWFSAQECQGSEEKLKDTWLTAIHHVVNEHEWTGPDGQLRTCQHEPLDEERIRRKKWLVKGSRAHLALIGVATDDRFLQVLNHCTRYKFTSWLENFHSVILKYLPKRINFSK
jgi:hypothetical protein